jgi:hypothetical protein
VSRDSSVGKMTTLLTRLSSSKPSDQLGGPYDYPFIGYEGFSPAVKLAGAWIWSNPTPITFGSEIKNVWSYTSVPSILPYFLESNPHYVVFADFLNEEKLVRGSNPHLSFNRPLPTRQTDWIILDVTNALSVIRLTRRVCYK